MGREGNLSQLNKLVLMFPSQDDFSVVFFVVCLFLTGNFTGLLKHVLNKGETSTVL